MTYDGEEIRVFVNARLGYNITYPYGNIRVSYLPFSIGAGYKWLNGGWNWDYHFNGAIDEVRPYDRALSSHEVMGLYHDNYELNLSNTMKRIWLNGFYRSCLVGRYYFG